MSVLSPSGAGIIVLLWVPPARPPNHDSVRTHSRGLADGGSFFSRLFCNAQTEGFGRFGCIADCGRYLKTSQLYIDLEDWVDSTKTNLAADEAADTFFDIDLTKMRRTKTPGFKFNIYSETMGDYIFAEDMPCNDTFLVDVPDGKFTLNLYQTNKLSQQIDSGDIYKNIYTLPDTLPERTATSDFAYGDKREAIATQAVLMDQINQHCWGGLLDLSVPAQKATFFKCLFRPSADTYLRVMGSYGITGVVSMSNGTKGRAVLVEVPYCGLVKDGNKGLRKNINKAELLGAAAACPASRRRALQDRRDQETGLDVTTYGVEKRRVLRELSDRHLERLKREPLQAARIAEDASKQVRAKVAHLFPDIKLERYMPEFASSVRAFLEDKEHPLEAAERYVTALGWIAQELVSSSSRRAAAPSSVKFGGTCTAHVECNVTSRVDPWLQAGSQQGLYCSGAGVCDQCSFCQWDKIDAIDKKCPTSQCPLSGSFPECVDAAKLTESFVCKDKFDFEIWKYTSKGGDVSISGPLPSQMVYATPFNRLVGPVMLSQARRSIKQCDTIYNPSVVEYANLTGCQDVLAFDPAPFGMDPVFVSTSAIYNGKMDPERFYTASERINKTTEVKVTGGGRAMVTVPSTPLGFFPHGYDMSTGGWKPVAEVDVSQSDIFKVFFDNRVSATQSGSILTYLQDGGFIDQQTHQVLVEFITFNPNLNHFCFVRFDFNWRKGGNINWDWFIQSVYVDIYSGAKGQAQVVVEVVVIIMLAVNCISQARDMMRAVRTFTFWEHLLDPGNAYDITHIAIMWAAWSYWAYHYDRMSHFVMNEDYNVLADPAASARFLATNSTEEVEYLTFKKNVQLASNSLEAYAAITSCSVILFILRLLKGLDFQEQLGLITRTVSQASYELVHFFFLFIIVFVGYVCTGSILFGHQVGTMSTLSKATVFLWFQIVAFDDTQFWQQFSHAAPYWSFTLFVWSYMFIVWLILFNILLAILIEAYVRVKGESARARGVHTDIHNLLTHWCKSWMLPKRIFMSDARLLECLERQKAGMPSTSQLRAALIDSIDSGKQVLLDGGIEVDEETMLAFVRPPDAEEITIKAKTMNYVSLKPSKEAVYAQMGTQFQDEDEQALVGDLMERYGDKPHDFDDQEGEMINHMEIEALAQSLATFRRQQMNLHVVEKLEWQLGRLCNEILPADEAREIDVEASKPPHMPVKGGVVQVTIVEARNLPKMDLLRSIDPYCLIFCASATDGPNTTGAVSFKTEIKNKNRHPVWDEECEIPIVGSVNMLTATVFDHDDLFSDDFVGCCHVQLYDLEPGVEVDDWYDIINPNMGGDRLKESQLHLKITYLPTLDGKLITNIDELIGGSQQFSQQYSQMEEEGNVDSNVRAAAFI